MVAQVWVSVEGRVQNKYFYFGRYMNGSDEMDGIKKIAAKVVGVNEKFMQVWMATPENEWARAYNKEKLRDKLFEVDPPHAMAWVQDAPDPKASTRPRA